MRQKTKVTMKVSREPENYDESIHTSELPDKKKIKIYKGTYSNLTGKNVLSFTFNICKDVTQELARTHFLHPLDGMTEFSSLLDPKYLNSILLFSEIDGKQIWLRSHNNFKYAYANLSED